MKTKSLFKTPTLKKFGALILALFAFAFAAAFLPFGENAAAQQKRNGKSTTQNQENALKQKFQARLAALKNKDAANLLDPCDAQPISFGQTINGSLAPGDCADPETGQLADVYIFNGSAGQAISSAMSSSQFDTLLVLFDLSGNIIAVNDDIDDTTTNSRIPPTGTLSLPFNGSYILFATSFDETGSGNYTLNLLSGTAACDFTLNPTSQFFLANGGSGTFSVTASGQACTWQATSNVSWITTSSSGTGSGTVNFNVAVNNTSMGRTGLITVGNKTFTVQQNPLSCSYSIAPVQPQIPAIGGQFTITVSASNTLCPTNVSSPESWITIQNPSGAGTRVLNYTVAPNNIPVARNATIFVGDTQFGILQWWRPTPFSFDTGGQANLAVFRPNGGFWFYKYNNFNTGEPSDIINSRQFGAANDRIAPADYDGDKLTDTAVFRDGNWYIIESRNFVFRAVQFGAVGDKPIPGDFDGDEKADISVYRPSTGSWYRFNSSNNQFVATQFGTAEDIPLMTDFNADGRNEISVYRPSSGSWYWLDSQTGAFNAAQFGIATDIPVPADYDGDSKTDIAVFRPEGGNWYRLNSSNGQFVGRQFGQQGDIPVPAEFDRDGKADIAVFRPSTGYWFRLRSTNGAMDAFQFGAAGDKPIPAAYQP